MATIFPSPFPESGQCTLSARETLQRAKVQATEFETDLPPVSRLGGRVDVLDGSNIKPIEGKQ
jgi:hypothetical protein